VASACQERWTDTIGEYGWDGELAGWVLSEMPPAADLAAAAMMIRGALQPAVPQTIKAELARLRATTISRNADQADLTLTFAAYADAFRDYPADIVIEACRFWARNEKFWPALSELLERMDRKFRRRRLLAEAIEQARDRPADRDAIRRPWDAA